MGRARGQVRSALAGFDAVFGTRRGPALSSLLTAPCPDERAQERIRALYAEVERGEYASTLQELQAVATQRDKPPLLAALEHVLCDKLIRVIEADYAPIAARCLYAMGVVERLPRQSERVFAEPQRKETDQQKDFARVTRTRVAENIRSRLLFREAELPSGRRLEATAQIIFWDEWSQQSARVAVRGGEEILQHALAANNRYHTLREASGSDLAPRLHESDWSKLLSKFSSERSFADQTDVAIAGKNDYREQLEELLTRNSSSS